MMPKWFLPIGVIISLSASVLASQALISGVFTLVNEAMKLHLWFKMKVNYPSSLKGQIYIPGINWFLMLGCMVVVLIFQRSENMEAAYGLAITANMLMTTLLLGFYYRIRTHNFFWVMLFTTILMIIETTFLIANLDKFFHGGWFSFVLSIG